MCASHFYPVQWNFKDIIICVQTAVASTTQVEAVLHLISHSAKAVVRSSTPSLQSYAEKTHHHLACNVKSKITSAILSMTVIENQETKMH